MIGYLDGILAARAGDGCIVDVGGVGYRVTCSPATLAALPPDGERIRLWTHTYVREDALALFGFATQDEQRLFEILLGVSGIGPKVSLGACAAFSFEAFRRALVTDDVDAIASIPGIGKKKAGRIVLELKEKMQLPDLDIVGSAPDSLAQARSALQNLGYSPAEVREALAEIGPNADEDVEEVVRSALRVLA